jgi:CheY-like chemotaxis protein
MSKILIVDDDEEIVSLLAELLKDEGHDVDIVTQSLRVYDRALETRPDLILMDIMMPYLDGWDEFKLFQMDERLRDVPVIVMTADRNAYERVDRRTRQAVSDHVFKPFELDELIEKIRAALLAKAGSRA